MREQLRMQSVMAEEKLQAVRIYFQTLVLISTVISTEIFKMRQCHFLAIHNRVQSDSCHPYVYHGQNTNGRKGNRGFSAYF